MIRQVLAVVGALVALGPAVGQTLLISNEQASSLSTYNVTTQAIGTFHTGLANPDGILFDPAGTLFATSFTGGTFNRITGPNTFTTIAGGMNGAAGFDRDAAGNFYIVNFGNPSGGGTNVSRVTAGGSITVNFATGLGTPDDIIFDNAGTTLYVSEWNGNRIRRINPTTGAVTPFVEAVGLNQPSAMAFDSAGNLYVTNWGNGTVSRITPGGVVTNNFATNVPNSFGLLLDEANGVFYATGFNDGTLRTFPVSGGAATVLASGFTGPTFIAVIPVPEPTTILAVSAVALVGVRRIRNRNRPSGHHQEASCFVRS